MQPIVLAHGFIGYRRFTFWSMFSGVAAALRDRGYTALQPMTHPTAPIEERAGRLAEFIESELGPSEPFHWIGHSMGGLDGRFMASPGGLNLGHRFLTLTTLSTPHRGSPLADRIPQTARNALSFAARWGRYLFRGEQRQFLDGLAENRWSGLDQLNSRFIQSQFNPKIIDHPQVRYYSHAGVVDYSQASIANIFRRPAWRYLLDLEGENDGMVSVQSARWGEFKGVLPADHGEMVGLRIIPWVKSNFDHVAFFVKAAQELEKMEKDILSTR
jgi:triacylglycerol lipase